MRKFTYVVIVILVFGQLHAQKNITPVFLNHVYFVLDSDSYTHILDNTFLQQIGTKSEEKTTTSTDSWSGKYFSGRSSYFEIFAPNGFAGAVTGNSGFGFMTFKQGDIEQIKQYWKENSKDSMSNDTTSYTSKGKTNSWYYSVYFYTPDSLLPVSAWVMENTPDHLKSVGFKDEEIRRPISWEEYSEKISGKKFTKAFMRITAVNILTNDNSFEYLKHSFLDFGLRQAHDNFYNDYIMIRCTRSNIQYTRIKKITIELNKSLGTHTLVLSNHITLHTKGKTASLNFDY